MSAKPYTDAPDAVTLHRDPGGYWHRWGDPGAPINGPEVKYVRADLWEAAVQDLAARDAELARLRAAVPADVAGLAKELRAYGFGGALSVAADALESQARRNADLASSNAALREQADHWQREFGRVVDERTKLEAVAKYARHRTACARRVMFNPDDASPNECDCGYSAALAQLDDGKSGEGKPKPAPAPKKRTCNRHDDCDAADETEKRGGRKAIHCWIEDCEDCFGC